ncbi:MAG: hypothetical protein AAFX06_14975 [Planctomycetota bacterium]
MIGLSVVNVKDNSRLLRAIIQAGIQRELDQFGQDVAKIAAEDQPNRPGTSEPGQPPNVHSGAPNLESVAYSVEGDAVVAGAPRVPNRGANVSRPVPGLLERGGRAAFRYRNKRGRKRTIIRRYRPRPVIVPAAMKALRRLGDRISSRGMLR